MKKNKHKSTEVDQSLFNDAMKDVKPLKQGEYVPPFKKTKKVPIRAVEDDFESINYALSDAQEHQTIQSDENISYASNGIQPRLLKKLRAGKFPIEDRLDLHGLTIDQARQQVSNFVFDSQSMGKKCVIIIHGKGSINNPPKLKTMLNHWLQQISDVLAFSSAQEQHGGNGAVYLLIKTEKTSLT